MSAAEQLVIPLCPVCKSGGLVYGEIAWQCDQCLANVIRPQPGPQSTAAETTADITIYGGSAGGGKMLPLDEPIPTPGGWTTIGELSVGDRIFGGDGSPCTVTQLHPIDRSPASWRLTFSDGVSILCCEDHLWRTMTREELTQAAPTGAVRTTKEIAKTLYVRGGRLNHSIDVAGAIQLPPAQLPLDPYLLGVWLSDGASTSGEVASRIGVIGDKHIPTAYLRASEDQRWAVLSGLMDTDGFVSKTRRCEFTTTSPAIRDDVVELIRTLGMSVRVGRDCGPRWRIKFTPTRQVFRLRRKAEGLILASRPTTKRRYIAAAERVDPVPMRCITVDRDDGLFIVGRDFLVTHNSWAMVYLAAQHVGVPGYGAIIFRRDFTQVTGPESLWEESQRLYPLLGGRARENKHEWRFRTGDPNRDAIIQFSHLQYEKNKLDHQGKGYAFIGLDELTHFTETQFWYLQSRNRTTCGVKPRTFGTTNPDPDSWVRRFIDWWIGEDGFPDPARNGVVRWFVRPGDELVWGDSREEVADETGFDPADVRSATFIRSQLEDNRILMRKDPSYRSTLMSLPRVERERLRGGNWDVKPSAGDYFNASWFEVVQERPTDTRKIVRAWDLAATPVSKKNPDPDWTVGARMSRHNSGALFIEDVVRLRSGPRGVERAYSNTASQDGVKIHPCFWQDPGQAGKVQIADIRAKLMGFTVETEVARQNKISYAMPVSSAAEGGNIKLVYGKWVQAFLRVLESFPDGPHDDDVDATSLGFLKLVSSNLERLRRLARWR